MHRHILIKRHKPRKVRIAVTRKLRKTEAEHFLELEHFINDVEHRIETGKIQVGNYISDIKDRIETGNFQVGNLADSDSSYTTTTSSSSSSSSGSGRRRSRSCGPSPSDDSLSSRRSKVACKTRFTEHLNFSDTDFDAALFEAAFNDFYPPEESKFRIKLLVNGGPPPQPRKLCVVGEIPRGCEEIVEDLRGDPENTYLLDELRKRGYRAIADPLDTVRHRCWCPTCGGGWNRGAGCCAVTVVARFGDGGDNSHHWAELEYRRREAGWSGSS